MSPTKSFRIFISHAWTHNDSYYNLVDMLKNARYFSWINYSVPEHEPLDTRTNRELFEALTNQIKPTNIIIILAGMYVNFRRWIQSEIDIANSFNKPMIGIVPRGGQRTPIAVDSAVKTMVRWNTQSIVDAIRRYSI